MCLQRSKQTSPLKQQHQRASVEAKRKDKRNELANNVNQRRGKWLGEISQNKDFALTYRASANIVNDGHTAMFNHRPALSYGQR